MDTERAYLPIFSVPVLVQEIKRRRIFGMSIKSFYTRRHDYAEKSELLYKQLFFFSKSLNTTDEDKLELFQETSSKNQKTR